MSSIPDDGAAAHAVREAGRDIAAGALCVLAAAALWAAHLAQPGRLHADFGAEPGPALLPELLLAALGGAGALLVARGGGARRRRRALHPFAAPSPPMAGALLPLALLGLAALALWAQALVGFGVATIALGAVVCALLSAQERGRLTPRAAVRAGVEGAAVAACIYGVFRFILSAPLT